MFYKFNNTFFKVKTENSLRQKKQTIFNDRSYSVRLQCRLFNLTLLCDPFPEATPYTNRLACVG